MGFLCITHPKLIDLDYRFRMDPMPLYVRQLRTRLNFGSALIRMHRHGSVCSIMSSVFHIVLYHLPANSPLLLAQPIWSQNASL